MLSQRIAQFWKEHWYATLGLALAVVTGLTYHYVATWPAAAMSALGMAYMFRQLYREPLC